MNTVYLHSPLKNLGLESYMQQIPGMDNACDAEVAGMLIDPVDQFFEEDLGLLLTVTE
jgi:hypothetical protein